jgi:hypothetical protein
MRKCGLVYARGHCRNPLTSKGEMLMVTVVPDSGTGRLAGITGKMTIDIVD